MFRGGEARSRVPGPGRLSVVRRLLWGVSPLPRSDESIRVATGGHVKSDDLSTVVDPIDCGRPDAIGIIDRRKLSVVKDETVGETRRIYVRPNDPLVIVQAESLPQRCPRQIDSPKLSL